MFSELTKSNLYLQYFGLTKIPLLWFCRPKIIRITSETVEIKIPLMRRTKNHLNSMYFGALSVGADITGGFLAMMCIQKSKHKVALIFKDFKGGLRRGQEVFPKVKNPSANTSIRRFVRSSSLLQPSQMLS